MLMEPIPHVEAMAAAADDRRARLAFAAILVLAFGLRLALLSPYGFFHPDETVQYLEQAHRLAFGTGVVPWDVRYGLRNALVPLLLSVPMRIGEALDPGGDLYLLLPRLCVMLLSLGAIWAAWAIGRRHSPAHGLAAAAVLAIWYEAIIFADHVMIEPIVTDCFLAAAALIDRPGRRRVAAGALLGFAAVLRPQYAPAAAILALLELRRDWRGWGALVAGAVPVLLASACVDVAMGQIPFGQAFANLRLNVIEHRAAAIGGTLPPFAYLGMLLLQWGPLALAAPLLIAPVARRHLALLAAALATLALHMAIGHKEYRYIWLPAETLLLLAAIGSAELATRAAAPARRRTAWLALILGWTALSAGLAAVRPMPSYEAHYADRLRIARLAGKDARLCGVAVYRTPYWTAGHAYLHRAVPLYLPWRTTPAAARRDLLRGTPAYNGLIAPADETDAPRLGYRPIACRGTGADGICLWERPGGCDARAAPDLEMQHVLRREDA